MNLYSYGSKEKNFLYLRIFMNVISFYHFSHYDLFEIVMDNIDDMAGKCTYSALHYKTVIYRTDDWYLPLVTKI